jgi:small subunit ribosomal protein S25e
LVKLNLIVPVSTHGAQLIYTRATGVEEEKKSTKKETKAQAQAQDDDE